MFGLKKYTEREFEKFKNQAALSTSRGIGAGLRAVIKKYNLPEEEAYQTFVVPFAQKAAEAMGHDLDDIREDVQEIGRKTGVDMSKF